MGFGNTEWSYNNVTCFQIGTYFHDNNKTSAKLSMASMFLSKWVRPKKFVLKKPWLKYLSKPKDLMPIFNNMPVSVVAVDVS
jgi:hypothetical protein